MQVEVRPEGPYAVVALSGEVDLHHSPSARKQLLAQLQAQRPVLVDLAAVEYIDSSGVASLVEGYQLARTSDLEFALVGVSEAVMRVLRLARLDQVFPIYASVSERLGHGG